MLLEALIRRFAYKNWLLVRCASKDFTNIFTLLGRRKWEICFKNLQLFFECSWLWYKSCSVGDWIRRNTPCNQGLLTFQVYAKVKKMVHWIEKILWHKKIKLPTAMALFIALNNDKSMNTQTFKFMIRTPRKTAEHYSIIIYQNNNSRTVLCSLKINQLTLSSLCEHWQTGISHKFGLFSNPQDFTLLKVYHL